MVRGESASNSMCEISHVMVSDLLLVILFKKNSMRSGYKTYEVGEQLIILCIPARSKFDPLADRSCTVQQLILSHV